MHRRSVLVLMLAAVACRGERAGKPDSVATKKPAVQGDVIHPAPLPALPSGPLAGSIQRGRAIMLATAESLPGHVGNKLRCVSCHLDEGRRPYAMPWTGVYARFPQYRSRAGAVNVLEDRINDCFERSLAGKALGVATPEMRDIVAYMAWLSTGVKHGDRVPGQGLDSVRTGEAGDTVRGAAVFTGECARCHGADGQGTNLAPPVWGSGSYSIGAGMARRLAAAAFVRRNMPYDKPGSLSDQQALDVAAFIDSRPRPDFAGKEKDWPKGGAPKDVAYAIQSAKSPK